MLNHAAHNIINESKTYNVESSSSKSDRCASEPVDVVSLVDVDPTRNKPRRSASTVAERAAKRAMMNFMIMQY
jgi:hypothetical protein